MTSSNKTGSSACGMTSTTTRKYIPGLPGLVGEFSGGLSFGARLVPAKIVKLNTTLQSQLRSVTSCDEASSRSLSINEVTILSPHPERLVLRIHLLSQTTFGVISLIQSVQWEKPWLIRSLAKAVLSQLFSNVIESPLELKSTTGTLPVGFHTYKDLLVNKAFLTK